MNLEIGELFSVNKFPTDFSAKFRFQRKTEQKPEKVYMES